tara:strand:+ start:290 stop:451 length:162 start_codon:yes stop_codon:yes gene_type:complete
MCFQRNGKLVFVITPSWLYGVDWDSAFLELKQEALDYFPMGGIGHKNALVCRG